MFDALDITEEEAQGLAELAMHDLALARDFARRAQAAEDADEASDLARSYQRMARSFRQTLALKVRLKRELEREARDAARWAEEGWVEEGAVEHAPPPGLDKDTEARLHQRKIIVRAAVTRAIWDEAEPLEVEHLLDHLEDDVELSGPKPSVLFTPQDEHVAQLVERMRHRLAAHRARVAASATPDVETGPKRAAADPAWDLRRSSA